MKWNKTVIMFMVCLLTVSVVVAVEGIIYGGESNSGKLVETRGTGDNQFWYFRNEDIKVPAGETIRVGDQGFRVTQEGRTSGDPIRLPAQSSGTATSSASAEADLFNAIFEISNPSGLDGTGSGTATPAIDVSNEQFAKDLFGTDSSGNVRGICNSVACGVKGPPPKFYKRQGKQFIEIDRSKRETGMVIARSDEGEYTEKNADGTVTGYAPQRVIADGEFPHTFPVAYGVTKVEQKDGETRVTIGTDPDDEGHHWCWLTVIGDCRQEYTGTVNGDGSINLDDNKGTLEQLEGGFTQFIDGDNVILRDNRGEVIGRGKNIEFEGIYGVGYGGAVQRVLQEGNTYIIIAESEGGVVITREERNEEGNVESSIITSYSSTEKKVEHCKSEYNDEVCFQKETTDLTTGKITYTQTNEDGDSTELTFNPTKFLDKDGKTCNPENVDDCYPRIFGENCPSEGCPFDPRVGRGASVGDVCDWGDNACRDAWSRLQGQEKRWGSRFLGLGIPEGSALSSSFFSAYGETQALCELMPFMKCGDVEEAMGNFAQDHPNLAILVGDAEGTICWAKNVGTGEHEGEEGGIIGDKFSQRANYIAWVAGYRSSGSFERIAESGDARGTKQNVHTYKIALEVNPGGVCDSSVFKDDTSKTPEENEVLQDIHYREEYVKFQVVLRKREAVEQAMPDGTSAVTFGNVQEIHSIDIDKDGSAPDPHLLRCDQGTYSYTGAKQIIRFLPANEEFNEVCIEFLNTGKGSGDDAGQNLNALTKKVLEEDKFLCNKIMVQGLDPNTGEAFEGKTEAPELAGDDSSVPDLVNQ